MDNQNAKKSSPKVIKQMGSFHFYVKMLYFCIVVFARSQIFCTNENKETKI